ncbi:MAG TPA: thioesterase domain-containing protein, partial [Pyrinomonadaceae bacterium]|nr:thioesterase domain-containing protein [Pyrinomonadaceae bacterium]
EVGEIEEVVKQVRGVREAVAVVREEREGEKRLVAYVVMEQSDAGGEAGGAGGAGGAAAGAAASGELRERLRERLPEYMIPSAIVELEELPLTANGKADRRALATMALTNLERADAVVAPRDVLELQLVKIWEELLGVQQIGVHDDFFAVGGHSLLAVRLLARIEQIFDRKLSLATLFTSPTIDHLASVIRERGHDTETKSQLVNLQPDGHRQPFFCVHPAGGNVVCYVALTRHLGTDQPFYGLQARGLNGEPISHLHIESMAADYIEAMRVVQAQGPYALGGWSVGGIIAFEMARQLQAQGQQVNLLALIDSVLLEVKDITEREDDTSQILHFARDLGITADQSAPTLEEFRLFDLDEKLACVLEQAKQARVVSSDITLHQLKTLFHVFKTNVLAARRYVPQSYAGHVHLFSAAERSPASLEKQVAGWDRWIAGRLEVCRVPGDHYSLLQWPQVGTLAGQLRACLDAAGAEQRTEQNSPAA